MQLSLSNVIQISVSAAQQGVGDYNVNNIGLFTNDVPANSFGNLGHSIYLDPTQVGVDFGSASETFAMANSIFSQQPNILAGGGYLAVIPFLPEQQTLSFSGISASGSFVVNYNGNASAAINWNDSASAIQTKLSAVMGLSQISVSGSIASQSLILSFYGIYNNAIIVSISADSLETSGSVAITVTPSESRAGEDLAAAIVRTEGLVQYFGILPVADNDTLTAGDVLAAAAVVQPLNKMLFVVSTDEADIEPGGLEDLIRLDGFSQTRALYYGDTAANALLMLSAYAGRALSTNFNGSNTTETMHLKDLIGLPPDPSMTQSILNLALAAGADTYVSLQGVPKVFTSGANKFFDQVYNLQWFVGALQVAGFNYLAESSTKVPQDEAGMSGLKGAYRAVCQQGGVNQYIAPGQWNNSTTFGNQVDFLANISQLGYYIYSQPVSQQSQTQRAARNAPLIQIAVKEAGAIQESTVIVYVNA